MHKVLCGLLLQTEILMHAAAGVDGEDDLQRQLGLALEHSDLLRVSILGEEKGVPIQPGNRRPLVIGNIDEDFPSRTLTLMVGAWAKPQRVKVKQIAAQS